MRYAFMTFSAPNATADRLIDLAVRYGYAGIEPRTGANHGHGIEIDASATTRSKIRNKFEHAGIAVAALATGCRFADPAKFQASLDEATASIQLAHDLGCAIVRVFGGPLPEGESHDRAMPRVVDGLSHLAGIAANFEVTLAMETHDSWTDPAVVSRVMRAVDHPYVGVNWDIMHPTRCDGVSISDAHTTLCRWIRHVHAHDGVAVDNRVRFKPIGAGEFDHAVALRLLVEGGYQGWVSGEWINWEPAEVHLPRELTTLRSLEHRAQS